MRFIEIKLDVEPGESINYACEYACGLATDYKSSVEFEFNSIIMKFRPGEIPTVKAKEYHDRTEMAYFARHGEKPTR